MAHHNALPTISFCEDTLRLHKFPQHHVDKIMSAAAKAWSGWTTKEGLTNIRFGPGTPFSSPSGEVTVQARLFMARLLKALLREGYYLYTSSCVTAGDMDTMYFERRAPWTHPEVFAISVHEHDVLRVIGAPPNVVDRVTSCILHAYHHDNVHVSIYGSQNGGCTQFKLMGSPWSSNRSSRGHVLLSHVFGSLAAADWRIYASIQLSHKSTTKDTWFFCLEPLAELVQAMPITEETS
ncbi:hypothetical protein H310_09880 [Aphanomyces invadans]|uniref:Uncharacterized protein n=1 Tax=Aphanomyces invadans TaxID=157072 RepID=A0A024TTU1_9STRA|nr:hypothetical protein H310_09880 [Aphanomyces invadans]ETV97051.1 hypothetical protein H310_09880 [Aphanomyces invadans]|eukprot:XP_008874297.1 hypothetical protein H310_09880 [Aphanomyces invadans]